MWTWSCYGIWNLAGQRVDNTFINYRPLYWYIFNVRSRHDFLHGCFRVEMMAMGQHQQHPMFFTCFAVNMMHNHTKYISFDWMHTAWTYIVTFTFCVLIVKNTDYIKNICCIPSSVPFYMFCFLFPTTVSCFKVSQWSFEESQDSFSLGLASF